MLCSIFNRFQSNIAATQAGHACVSCRYTLGGLSLKDIRETLAAALTNPAWSNMTKKMVMAVLKTRELTVQLLELSGVPRFVQFAFEGLKLPTVLAAVQAKSSGWQTEVACSLRTHVNARVCCQSGCLCSCCLHCS